MGKATGQKGQGNAGGWPSTKPGVPSGGGRSNNAPSKGSSGSWPSTKPSSPAGGGRGKGGWPSGR